MSAAPLIDPRRLKALRAALADMAPALAPEWGGPAQEGDFGAALYEIAARLAEHSTRRLDQAPLRDKLAFLDTLDIPAPAPRSATVPIVFTLAEKRTVPVYAAARVQVAAATDGDPVVFETREAIAIAPARVTRLIVADPALDRIELAPARVIGPPQPAPPAVTYRLVSAAETSGKMLQLAQAVGIDAGDLLRIAGTTYRVAKRSGEMVTLLDALEAPAAAGAAVEKVTRLNSFSLRNLSRHEVYVGDKELLKLDGPAMITLRLDPPGLVRRLTELDIAYELWGKSGSGPADWQPLRLLGGRDGELKLAKDRAGAVEEVEAEGRKSRWLRLRLLTGISDAAPPETRAASVEIKVNSVAAAEPKDAKPSVVGAFHNGLALPLTTAFLPFGPEPQRFDTFAIAAPEALSKKGAAVKLKVVLSDASLGSLAAVTDATDRIYGVGRNGRLHAIRFDAKGAPLWRQLNRPPAASGGGAGIPRQLDANSAFYAFQSQAGPPANDVIVVRDNAKALWMAAVRSDDQDWSVTKWTVLPPPPGNAPPDDFCVLFTRAEGPAATAPPPVPGQSAPVAVPGPAQAPIARLLAAGADGLWMQTVDPADTTPRKWQALIPGLAAAPTPPLRLAAVAGGNGLLVAVDAAGAVFWGRVTESKVEWAKMKANELARSGVQPAAVLHGGKVHVVVATTSSANPVAMLSEGDNPRYPPAGVAVADILSITCLPARAGEPDFPLVAVVGANQIMIWSDEKRAVSAASPGAGQRRGTGSLLVVTPSGAAKLILAGADERLFHAPIDSAKRILSFTAWDLARVDAGSDPQFMLVDGQSPKPIDAEPVGFAGGSLLPVPRGRLALGDRYFLLSQVAGAVGTGKRVAGEPQQLELPATDTQSKAGDFLRIGSTLFEIDAFVPKRRVAVLEKDLPGNALVYAAYRQDDQLRVVSGAALSPVPNAVGTGARVADQPAQLALPATGTGIKAGDFLEIGSAFFKVASFDGKSQVATLAPDLPPDALDYKVHRKNDDGEIEPAGPAAVRTGTRVAGKPRQLTLDDDDKTSAAGDFLNIGGAFFEIASLDPKSRVAVLKKNMPGSALPYAAYRRDDQLRLVSIGGKTVALSPVPDAAGTGARVADKPAQLELAAADTGIRAGDILAIGSAYFRIASLKGRVLTLAKELPSDALAYEVHRNNDKNKLVPADPPITGTGARVSGQPGQLALPAADSATQAGDSLKIGSQFFKVVSFDPDSRVAILKTNVPSGALAYQAYGKGSQRKVVETDLATLLGFAAGALPGDVSTLEFAADPKVQGCILPVPQPAGASWARVALAWKEAPKDGKAILTVARSIGAWTQLALPRSAENPELSWEYFDGSGWRRLDSDFADGTSNLASSGTIGFTVPGDLAATEVAGKQDYWIQARLIGGDYGRPSYVVDTSVAGRQSITVDRSTVNPPEIVSIEASYDVEAFKLPETVLTLNNLALVDQTQAAAAHGADFQLFEGLAEHARDIVHTGRSTYLCLSRAPAIEALSLYVDASDTGAPMRRLQAEVLRSDGWAGIACEDGTAGLSRPGLLRLFLSTAPVQLPLFGCDGWWIRLRPHDPADDWAPVVCGLYLNAVTAEQAKSLRQEILGTSLGAPDQRYALAEPPVLPETLELRVRESLSDEERAELRSQDAGAVASYEDVDGEWVRWCATDTLIGQGGAARLFRLDPSTGEVRFGNGRDGKIPPAGRDAIRAVAYQSGGGSRGNVRAFAVNQLKTSLESVELSVNPVDAGGGADAPPQERLAETGPARLRHANRALAPADVEAFAIGSSPDVVRARCLRRQGCGIDVVVAIRHAGERCPTPSRARREGISAAIGAAGWGALPPEAIRVHPPRYVHVKAAAAVIASSAELVAAVDHEVHAAILAFLHSTDGGPDGLGWPFGRRPWPSDLQRLVAAMPGVDRVVEVTIAARDAGDDLDRLPEDALICADEDDVTLDVQPPARVR